MVMIETIANALGGENVKTSKSKLEIAMARVFLNPAALSHKAGVPYATLTHALAGKKVRPETAGKIAAALGVDVTEIIE